MATIDLDAAGNLAANLLKESTAPRGSTPNGNIYFDVTNGELQIITSDELATVDFGVGAVENPLKNLGASSGGITARALYKFERERRSVNETLRKYALFLGGSYKYAGAYEMQNGRKIASADVRKVRGSGMVWRSASGAVNRIYFGVRTLNPIGADSQVYRQLSDGGATADMSYPGAVDEMFQVFGTTANGDTGAGSFDTRSYMALSVRTFGQNFDRKLLTDSGLSVMDGFSAGFALGETEHTTTGSYTLADVYGAAAVAPFTGLSLEKLAVAQTETGFSEGDGAFSWVLSNTDEATLAQCVAYLDAVALTDEDVDAGAGTVYGKRINTWYTYDSTGRVVTRSGAGDGLGLFIEGLTGTDKQSIVQTANDGPRTYPFFPTVRIPVGQYAKADPAAWYHVFFLDVGTSDFGTDAAITVLDSAGNPVKGLVAGADTINFEFSYDSDTLGGTAGTDKAIVIEVEGNGVATAAKTDAVITRAAVINAPCQPGLETAL